jgi:hypothetical protein
MFDCQKIMARERTASEPAATHWRLPFDLHNHPPPVGTCGGCCLLPGVGMCVQGNDGNDTHSKELRFAFDFALPVGTPLLAVADGVVAAAEGGFRVGNRSSKEMRARANYVALRHSQGLYSRYYHLCEGGVEVAVGERVQAGQRICRSGNTGFSGAPHLHWDLVDVLPTETATLTLTTGQAQPGEASDGDGDRAQGQAFACAAACFSSALPALGTRIIGRALISDPPTANAALRNDPSQLQGAILLMDRCTDVDFIDKAKAAEAAGAAAVVVCNFAEAGSSILTMGIPALATVRSVGIPALMVTHATGEAVREAVRTAPEDAPPRLLIGRSEWFVARSEQVQSRQQQQADTSGSMPPPDLAPATQMSTSDFVPRTLPARFAWPGHSEGYLPTSGRTPPALVQRNGDIDLIRRPQRRQQVELVAPGSNETMQQQVNHTRGLLPAVEGVGV